MPQPTGSDLHIDTFLSNLGVAYMNEPAAYIADQVFPAVPVDHRSDLYPIYQKDYWFRDEAKKRAPLTESAGGGFELEEPGTYYCYHWSFHQDISDDDIANQDDVFDLEDDATAYVTEKLRLRREREWATNFFGTGIWGNDLVGGVDFTLWSDQTNSNPITDIENWKALVHRATGLMPNTLVVARRVHQTVKNNDQIIERYKYTKGGVITAEILASIFEIDRYIVGSALYAANEEGDTEDLQYILGEYSLLLVYAAPRPSRRRPSGGYTFRWRRPRIGGRTGERLPFTIKKWSMADAGIEGTRVEGNLYEDMRLIASDCGVFCSNVFEEEES